MDDDADSDTDVDETFYDGGTELDGADVEELLAAATSTTSAALKRKTSPEPAAVSVAKRRQSDSPRSMRGSNSSRPRDSTHGRLDSPSRSMRRDRVPPRSPPPSEETGYDYDMFGTPHATSVKPEWMQGQANGQGEVSVILSPHTMHVTRSKDGGRASDGEKRSFKSLHKR